MVKSHNKKVFHTLAEYLDPRNHSYIPLVELPNSLNPYRNGGVRIYAKIMTFLPLANVKSIPAYKLVESAPKSTREFIEASSGNTVLSIASIARAKGIEKTTALVSKEVSPGKLKLLRLMGVDVEIVDEPICPDPGDPNGAIQQARRRGREEGVYNAGQYDNNANPHSHYEFSGPEILDQLEGKVDIFAAGLGTTGSLVGMAKAFKKAGNCYVIGIARTPNNTVPGVRTHNLLREVSFPWSNHVDHVCDVGTEASYRRSLELIRHGIFVGPSSGFALAGLYEGLEIMKQKGLLDGSEKNAVCIFPDGPLAYSDDYFEYLPDSEFPQIKNEHLLPNKMSKSIHKEPSSIISAEELKAIMGKEDVKLIDVRTESEFEDHHIVGSINIPIDQLESSFGTLSKTGRIVFICRSGSRSNRATEIAIEHGYANTSSLDGGTIRWSQLGYERVRPNYCPPL